MTTSDPHDYLDTPAAKLKVEYPHRHAFISDLVTKYKKTLRDGLLHIGLKVRLNAFCCGQLSFAHAAPNIIKKSADLLYQTSCFFVRHRSDVDQHL